jgi:hypothetical protein
MFQSVGLKLTCLTTSPEATTGVMTADQVEAVVGLALRNCCKCEECMDNLIEDLNETIEGWRFEISYLDRSIRYKSITQ